MLTALGAVSGALAGCLDDGSDDGRNGDEPDRSSDNERNDDEPDQSSDERNDNDEPTHSDGKTPTGSVRSEFDDEPNRPECTRDSKRIEVEAEGGETREYETAATVPYPDAPAAYTTDGIVDFVDEFEHGYVTHDVLCDRREPTHVLEISYNVQESETWDEDPTVVFLLRTDAIGSMLHEDGSVSVADVAPSGVVYAVDESGAARVEFDEAATLDSDEWQSRAPDPLADGDLVATFE
ncbi:hypothetical protein KWG76_17820 [Haloterrigena longa]|uniref:Uncharacterized protein n=2 Tax=Natrinema longum TaxID=370324 RepID=A0A8A2UGX7_9EURY|nr:hypothetical protein [Natrinema longum]QSW86905.1 hypothetical protein J0X27_00415 [Natrinema longum]